MRTTILALALLALPATAQLGGTPKAWPLGCPVPATLANDGQTTIETTPCMPLVTDAAGNLLYLPLCLQVVLFLQPGDTYTSYWNQTDGSGQQVPPGVYYVNGRPYDLGAASCAIQPLGSPFVGATRSIELCAPGHAGQVYVLGASTSAALGIPLGCGNTFPLDATALLTASLSDTATFTSFVGVLDAFGRTNEPAISVPMDPSLAGFTSELGFVTLDPMAPCGIGAVCGPETATIL